MIKNIERKRVFTELAKGERVYQICKRSEDVYVLNYETVDSIIDDLQNDDFEYFKIIATRENANENTAYDHCSDTADRLDRCGRI